VDSRPSTNGCLGRNTSTRFAPRKTVLEILDAWFKVDKPEESEAANIRRIGEIER